MAINYNDWKKCYSETEINITSSTNEWLKFLNTCSNIYRMPFKDQIAIYFQKPNATKLDTYVGWKEKGYQVVYGAKSLALFNNTTGTVQRLFDISSTKAIDYKKHIDTEWAINQNDIDFVKYSIEPTMYNAELSEVLLTSIKRELSTNTDNYKDLIVASVAYICNLRCGVTSVDTDAMQNLILPESAMTLHRVGTTINYVCNIILSKIEKSLAIPEKTRYDIIRGILQQNYKEVENYVNAENNISLGRGYSSTKYNLSGTTESRTVDEVRTSEASISSREERTDVSSALSNRGIGEVSQGGTREGKQFREKIGEEVSSTARSDRGIKSERPDEMGSDDEQLSIKSGGNSYSGDYQQLNIFDIEKAEYVDSAFLSVDEMPTTNNSADVSDFVNKNPIRDEKSEFQDTVKSFAEQVDEVINGTFSRYSDLKVCDTPDILLQVGCEQLPIFYTQRHLRDALKEKGYTGESIHHHGLSLEQLYDIPNQLANPVMIYDSLSSNNSIVVVTDKLDNDNLPIIAVIKPNGTAKYDFEIVDLNFMVSVYGRNNFENQINRALEDNKILYCNKEKSRVLFSVLGLQLSKGFNSFDFNIIIHQSNNIVNTKTVTKNEDLMTKTEGVSINKNAEQVDENHLNYKQGDYILSDNDILAIYTNDNENIAIAKYPNEYVNLYGYDVHTGTFTSEARYFKTFEDAENILHKHRPSAIKNIELTREVNPDLKETMTFNKNSAQIEQNFETEHPGDLSKSENITLEEYSRTTEKKVAANNNNVFEQKEIDHILQLGINTNNGRMVVALDYMKGKSIEELTATLKQVYHGGYGLKDEQPNISVWYAEDGIHLAQGNSAEYVENAQVIPWEDVAVRIGELLENGQYATNVELVEAASYERQKIAESLWYLYSDFADGIRETGILSSLSEMRGGGFSDDVVALAEKLTDPKFRVTLQTEYQTFMDAYKAKPDILRFHYHKVNTLEKRLKELDIHLREYQTDLVQLPLMSHFIIEDEINHAMTRGSRFSDGKRRIWDYWQESHSSKEKADFLKNEYGTGGHSYALSGTSGSSEDYDSTGLRYKKNGCEEIKMSWIQAASRLDNLVHNDRYLTDKEKAEHNANLEAKEKKEPVTEEVSADKAIDTKAVPKVPVTNYHITDDHIGEGGPKQKFVRNIEAIQTLFSLEAENRNATSEEQEILAKYVGWGGLPDVFDVSKENWSAEYGELKKLLSPAEYAAARSSTLNAHFTSPVIIKGIYDVLNNLGFVSGNILEPSMGIGNFFGMLPESMSKSRLYGVEIDSITGRIAKQLYPDAFIEIKGFEKTIYTDNTFDVVIGNVPFGNYQVNDRDYNKYGLQIHDYFIAKSIDKVRPGGVVAVVTSKGTMDKKDNKAREYFAERAELLGAIRLPNSSFKKNAGTEVTSDVLFFQKRQEPIELTNENRPLWVDVNVGLNDLTLNKYFVENQNMIVGEMREISGRFGIESACILDDENKFIELFNAAKNCIEGKITEIEFAVDDESTANFIQADPNIQNFNYAVVNGEVYYRRDSIMEKMDFNATKANRIIEMVNLRDCTRKLINLQLDEYPDRDIQQQQQELNTMYDNFVDKYGRINSRANSAAMDGDNSYCLLCSLENFDSENKFIGKADMFTKRTIRNKKAIDYVETSAEALSVSLAEKGKVDIEYMAKLCGTTVEEVIKNSNGVIFLNPVSNKFETNDEYLSGNVREKLAIAEQFAANNDKFNVNVEALKAIQPKDIEAADIDVRLGATWVDAKYINQFMDEILNKNPYVEVVFTRQTSEWYIKNKNYSWNNISVESTYGIPEANAYYILENALNLKDMKITYKNSDDKYVVDEKATMIANQKQQELKEAFKDWIFKDMSRRDELTKVYNEKFNSIRLREYDGSILNFVGMSPEITLLPHQTSAIARTLFGGNSLLAHCVGAGKTFEMVASAMESKRLGLCHKPMFVVPNHLTQQWGSEFLRLYPGANILVTSKKDFEPANRRKFCSKIATGNWDAVIIGHSQFERIPLSQERQAKYLQTEIDEIVLAIEEMKILGGEGRSSIKSLEKTKKSLSQHLEKLMDTKKDDVITFEQLGVDKLYVDESHNFKNLFFHTKMRNVSGLAQTEAKKSTDIYTKCRYIDEITDNKGIVFASGTPISNSMTELYTNMRYLHSAQLKRLGLINFDAWASTFGETVTAVELKPEGNGYRAKTRFAKFFNLPELMNIFKEFADIQTADMLNLPVPEVEYHNEVLKPTDLQKDLIKSLADRAEIVRNGGIDSSIDNMLKITNDGRKIALDQRLYDSVFGEASSSKTQLLVENAFRLYTEYSDIKGTQLIFCDLSTPKNDGSFDVYNDIKQKLIAKGVPDEEIAFIHDANTDTRKKDLFSKVRSGNVRFLLGSTFKMGAGTNVQDRLIGLHHLDVPWRPSDIEQREGRILRQGNMNRKVHIFRYVTEGTFDSYSWQIIENKQKFIGQIMTSKSPIRAAEDIDETALSYAEVKALATGNPLIKEKMDLDIKVSKLALAKANYNKEIYRLENVITNEYPSKITKAKELLTQYTQDVSYMEAHYSNDNFSMIVDKKTYTKPLDAMTAILNVARKEFKNKVADLSSIGSFCGFKIDLSYSLLSNTTYLILHRNLSHSIELGDSSQGNVARFNNLLEKMPLKINTLKENLSSLENNFLIAQNEVKQPFKYEAELKIAQERLLEVETAINKKPENSISDTIPKYREGQQINGLKDIVAAAEKQLSGQQQHPLSEEQSKNNIDL